MSLLSFFIFPSSFNCPFFLITIHYYDQQFLFVHSFVRSQVNGKNSNARSLEETLEGMPHSNESIVVELRRRDARAVPKHPKPLLRPLNHGFRENSRGNFQTLSSSDDQAASSTMTSDYICIDKGHDPDEDNDDEEDNDDGDDEYGDLELWCGSKELSSNFITHM